VFEGVARSGPILVIFEDVHWVDPSTLEVLESLVGAAASLRVLMVVTHRPEFEPTWHAHGHVSELRLSNLRRADCNVIIDRLCDHKALPDRLHREILLRTDGVPLFVEELTKAVLASGMLVSKGNEYVQLGPASEVSIPSTLNDSLMARLDRLGSAREIAQIGACIGREFPYSLVLAVSSARSEQVDEALRDLETEQLIYRRGDPPQARYTFKHALIRDAAAGSLLRQDRGEIHRRIAAALEATAEARDNQPELLAHHYSEAGAAEEAATYWLRAAQRASRQQAYREAIAHVMAGLELLHQLPEGTERDRREIDFQMVLGSASLLSKGYGAAEAEHAYTRAWDLFEDSMIQSGVSP
jgi:predicted ATPase